MPTDLNPTTGQTSPRRSNGIKTADPDIEGPVLTSREAALLLKVSEEIVKTEAEAGRLPGRKLGDQWRFGRVAVIDWLNQSATLPRRGGQVIGTTSSAEFVETPEEFAAFLAHIEAARDEEDRLHGFGKYAPE